MKSFKQHLAEQERDQKINTFVAFACKHLGLDEPPHINIVDDKKVAQENTSFGGYYPGRNRIDLNVGGRHLADCLRTLAHELVHRKQDVDGRFDGVEMAGETGSTFENEANSEAGIMLRNYGKANPCIYEQLNRLKLFEEEQPKPKASSNTKGVLHELLVGYHLNGGKHMEKHPDVNGDFPRQAHEKLKSSISKEEYKTINEKAKGAANHIRNLVGSHGNVHHVRWTSKPGDLHRTTGIHASQKEDASDVVVTTKNKLGEVKHHGISLKVTDQNTGHVPISNPGMEATHGGKAILENHRETLLKKYPKLKGMAKPERKEYLKTDPKADKEIKTMNQKVLSDIVDHTHHELSSMSTKDLAKHIRTQVLHAHKTPMQENGHSHYRVTSYGNNTHHHMDPSADHEHILNDHKNIKVEKRGTSVVFTHKGKPFARHRMKFESQSDPMSSIKGSGEMI